MFILGDFLEIDFLESGKILMQKWGVSSATMTTEQFQAVQKETLQVFVNSKANFILADTKHFNFIITPELQDWIFGEIVEPLYHAELRKIAYISPESLFANFSIEQTLTYQPCPQLNRRYFHDEQEAVEWLLS